MNSRNCVWSESIDRLLSPGVSLLDAGVNNWALSKSQSLAALGELEKLVVAVLGGDVYQINDGRADDRGEGWYGDPEAEEPNQSFVTRSIEEARDYITRYAGLSPAPLFAIVPDIKASGVGTTN